MLWLQKQKNRQLGNRQEKDFGPFLCVQVAWVQDLQIWKPGSQYCVETAFPGSQRCIQLLLFHQHQPFSIYLETTLNVQHDQGKTKWGMMHSFSAGVVPSNKAVWGGHRKSLWALFMITSRQRGIGCLRFSKTCTLFLIRNSMGASRESSSVWNNGCCGDWRLRKKEAVRILHS